MLMWVRLGRLAAGLFRLTLLAGLLAGVPYGLVTQIGWPLPRTFPRTAEQVLPQLQEWLTTPVTDQVVLNLFAVAMWILWGSFTASVIVEAPSRMRGVVPRRVPVLAPMQSLTGWLLSGITVGVLATGTLAAPAPTAADPVPEVALVIPGAEAAGGVATANAAGFGPVGSVGLATAGYTTTAGDRSDRADEQLVHEVARGDWMWHIAGRYLGNEDRYPEIAQLNPSYADRYEDYPDHIQPGDQLVLPDDARDRGERPQATGETILTSPAAPTPDPPPPPVEPPEPPSPSPPATVAPEPSPTPATPQATPTPPAEHGTPEPGPGTGETSNGDEDAAGDQPQDPATPPGAGVELPSGAWISLGLAALLAAVATVLRLSRRRRARLAYPIQITTEPEPSPVPDSLRPADAAGLRALETTDDNDEQDDSPLAGVMSAPPAVPAAVGVDEHGQQVSLFDLPGDGLCLHGQGAMPAGRAILAAACSTGVSQFPGARPMVLTSVDTLAALLPPEVVPVGLDPHGKTFDGERLTVAADVGQAVTRAEEEMIARRRLLDELDAEDMDTLNAGDDHAEQQPRSLSPLP